MKSFSLSCLHRVFQMQLILLLTPPVFSITIQDAFDSALRSDPTLRASRFSQDASSENITIAKSRFLPQIALQGSSNRLIQNTTQDVPGNGSMSRSFSGPSVNHQFVIKQAILRPRDSAAIGVAELQAQFGKVKYRADTLDLWIRVVNAWIELVGSMQLVESYEKPLQLLLVAVKQENTKFLQGDGTKDAIIEAEAQYQFALAIYQQSLHALNGKKQIFKLLTQFEVDSTFSTKLELNPCFVFTEKDRDRLWMQAREKSMELQLAEIQEQMQRERTRMVKADHLPTLDFLAAVTTAKNDATSTQGYRYQNNQIGIQYMIPIYSGGSISAAERQAAMELEASMANSEALANRLDADFGTLWSAWLGQRTRVQAGFRLLESSKEHLKSTQLAYTYGVKTLMELANAELALSRRLADQINMVMDYQKYTAKLSKNDFNLNEKKLNCGY